MEKTINILKNLSIKRRIQKTAKEIYKEVAEIDIYAEESEIKNDIIQKFKENITKNQSKRNVRCYGRDYKRHKQ